MKKIISIILVSTLLISVCSVFNVSATQKDEFVKFNDIDEVNNVVNDVFFKNYDKFVYRVKEIRPDISIPNEYITFESNCGPCSFAFQEILYNNNILTECQKKAENFDHIYNFMRTSFVNTPNIVTNIVIDSTFKQYLTQFYSKEKGLTFDDLANDVPKILVYEYGNYEMLKERLSGLKNHLDENSFEEACNFLFECEYKNEYVIQDLQKFQTKTSYSPKMIEDCKTQSGKYNITPQQIYMSNELNKKEFTYCGNGIYRCYITKNEISDFENGFYITDKNNNYIYGAAQDNDTVYTMARFSMQSYQDSGVMLNTTNLNKIRITQTTYDDSYYLVNIDVRAGINKAYIYIGAIFDSTIYGDVNSDENIDINDVTMLQKSIANNLDTLLNTKQTNAADVCKCGYNNINNATEITKYIAGYTTNKCGSNIYFTKVFNVENENNFGFVDDSCMK